MEEAEKGYYRCYYIITTTSYARYTSTNERYHDYLMLVHLLRYDVNLHTFLVEKNGC